MYMLPYRCNVTGTPGTLPVGLAVPPTWCEDDQANCTPGPKQMIYWNQAEGNNIEVEGKDLSGAPRSPAYNNKLGFKNGTFFPCSIFITLLIRGIGAQTDIFVTPRPAPPNPQPQPVTLTPEVVTSTPEVVTPDPQTFILSTSTLTSSRFFLPTSVSPPGVPPGPRSTVSATNGSRLPSITNPNWLWVLAFASSMLCSM
jgi:hypothetical protein